jgi:hypothetical protein
MAAAYLQGGGASVYHASPFINENIALVDICNLDREKVLQAGEEAVIIPLSQYHLGAGYALNWCEATHYLGRESASG